MAHEIAKLILEHAESIASRQEAIKRALALGMPLREIEEYLDWLDHLLDPFTATESREQSRPSKRARK